jgi:hypothetical protein
LFDTGQLAQSWPIDGDARARGEIRAALQLIRDLSDRRYWRLVTSFRPRFEVDAEKWGVVPGLGLITINDAQRNYYGTSTVHADVNASNRQENIKYLAGSIVHGCVHAAVFRRGDDHADAAAEQEALTVQLDFLTVVQASPDMRAYIQHEIENVNSPDSYWWHYANGQVQP